MRIDLHIHTSPRSPCSNIGLKELIQRAVQRGLDGLCLTEHQVLWRPDEVQALADESGIRIFRGNEFTTNLGDILVFGFEKDIKEVLPIQELREQVQDAGGFMIAAHPFRDFKTFGVGQLQMTVEQACRRKVFQFVDAVEVKNGKVSDSANDMAGNVALQLGLPGTGGSDAHVPSEIGKWVTVLQRDVRDEQGLIEELRAGRFGIESGL